MAKSKEDKQASLDAYGIKSAARHLIPSDKQIRAEVVKFIALGLQPFSLIEEPAFVGFLKFAFPDFKVPVRSTLTLDMENLHDLQKKS